MATIESKLCDAMELIVNNAINNADFDKTVQATIVACIDEATGKYKVKYQDNTFYAYSSDVEKKYTKGNRVYILIPGNDMTRDKTILGTVGQNKEYASTEAGTTYRRISRNFIMTQNSNYKIYSGTAYNFNENDNNTPPLTRYGKIIYNYNLGGSNTIKLLKEEVIKECIDSTNYIELYAKFQTNFPQGIVNGNYGLRVTCLCGSANDYYYIPIILDFEHGIIGDYYGFFTAQSQRYQFQKPDNFVRIQRIEIFAKEFDKQLTDPVDESFVISSMLDITVSELGIYAVNKVDTSITTSGIDIDFPRGIFLLESMAGMALTAKAQVYDQGKVMNDDANKFFWFKKDSSVNKTNNDKYHKFGGLGWSCLNDKREKDWIPASCNFEFNEQEHLTIYKNKFKVVSYRESGQSSIIHKKEFTLFNDIQRDKEIRLTCNKEGNHTPRAVNDLGVKCEVLGKEINATYSYYWEITTNNGYVWIQPDEIKSTFDCTIGTDSNGNGVIENITLKKLNFSDSYLTFTCTVIKTVDGNSTVLGAESLNVAIEEKNVTKYTLEILNGTQQFPYSEDGEAPTVNGTFELKPLSIQLIDNEKNELVDLDTKITENKLTIQWILPENPSLLDVTTNDLTNPINGNFKGCNFRLKSPYSYDNIDSNVIEVNVKYDGADLTASTNFVFFKQGDSGTNGTEYTANIIPVCDAGVKPPRWIVFTTDNTNQGRSGYFNFKRYSNDTSNYAMDETGCYANGNEALAFPFAVQLMRNGQKIYNGITGQDSANKTRPEIKVTWEMQIKNYGNNIKDRSNYSLVYGNPGIPTTMKFIRTLYTEEEMAEFTNEDLNRTPANILKCIIEYRPNKVVEDIDFEDDSTIGFQGEESDSDENSDIREDKVFKIYATLPIVTVVNRDTANPIAFDINSGYSQVVYNTDACHPWYDSSHNSFNLLDLGGKIKKCRCFIKGYTDLSTGSIKTFNKAQNLILSSDDKKTNFNKVVTPVYRFNGESVTNAVLLKVSSKSYIHIPIDLHLNRYGLRMLNDWDGVSIDINNDGGYILAPQMGAGKKNSDNTFTGILMGDVKDNGASKSQTGMFALNHGERTFSLMAETGLCAIGKRGRSQIIIDPSAEIDDGDGHVGASGCIYSGNFFKDKAINQETGFVKSFVLQDLWWRYADNREKGGVSEYIGDDGMLIDFSNGHIYFANGNFHLYPNGYMVCRNGHLTNNYVEIFEEYYTKKGKKKYKKRKIDKYVENYFIDLRPYRDKDTGQVLTSQKYFLYCRSDTKKSHLGDFSGEKEKFYVTKGGFLYSISAKIGGFEIDENSFTTADQDKSTTGGYRKSDGTFSGTPTISFSTESFKRDDMIIVSPVNYENELIADDKWEETDDFLLSGDDSLLIDNSPISDLLNGGNSGGGNSGGGLFGDDDNNNSGGGGLFGDDDNGGGGSDDGGLFGNSSLLSTSLVSSPRKASLLRSGDGLLSGDNDDLIDSSSDDNLFGDNDDDLFGGGGNELLDPLIANKGTKDIKRIDLEQRTVENLLFAIGDMFGVTTEGRLHTKEAYLERTAFKYGVCEGLKITDSLTTTKFKTYGLVQHLSTPGADNRIETQKSIYLYSYTDENGNTVTPSIYIDDVDIIEWMVRKIVNY